MQGNYSVQFEPFSESHFIKSFKKKYKSHWDVTQRAIVAELERIDNLISTEKAETICDDGVVKIVKVKFRIAGTTESAKTSGNRCIVAWHESRRTVCVLMVYGKTDLSPTNETAQWQKIIKNNYPEYKDFF